jgi:PAS domain S-box-containing protein
MPDFSPVTSNDCTIAFDPDEKKFLFISPNINKFLGYDAQDFYKNSGLLFEIIDPQDRENVKVLTEKLAEGECIDLHYQVKTPGGEVKMVYDKKSVIADQHNGRKVLLSIISDRLPEKMRYQEEATRTKNSLEALINNTEDQIWSVDMETRYVYMNKAYRNQISSLTGAEPKEGDYSNRHKGFSVKEIKKWKQYYNRALAGERYSIINESIDPFSQQVLSFEISFNPIYKVKGDITGVGCFARNITERLNTEKAMVDQNERLRHIASLTSHELRRPVASMIGLINIMDRSNFFNPDNKEVIEHLLVVGNEIDEVIRLIVDKTFMDGLTDHYRTPGGSGESQ